MQSTKENVKSNTKDKAADKETSETSSSFANDNDEKTADTIDNNGKTEVAVEYSKTLNEPDDEIRIMKSDEEHEMVEDPDPNKNNKPGQARTPALVINLDDKSRFSEEVTV